MKYRHWVRTRMGRLLTVLLALLIYFLLLTVDGLRFFPQGVGGSSFLLWLRFGFSALVALLFLAIGTLVWLYARNRQVALLLFCFTFTMMAAFAVETGASSDDSLLSAIGDMSSVLSVFLFALLLLFFPKSYLSSSAVSREEPQLYQRHPTTLLLRGYVAMLVSLGIVAALHASLYAVPSLQHPSWIDIIGNIFYLVALTGILITIVLSYHRISSLRQGQQQRLFVSGVILAFAPLLLLTILPVVLNFPQYSVDGQITTITLGFLPLALGYTILRYQVLIFDMYIRRSVAWLIGSVGLVILGYGVFICGTLVFAHNPLAIFLLVTMGVLAPCVWALARNITDRLFFTEMLHYRRLIEQPDALANETFDLNKASQLITIAAVSLFETQEVCLFVLDEATGYYHPYPPLQEGGNSHDEARRLLVQRLLQYTASSEEVHTDSGWIKANAVIIRHVESAQRPLLLREAIRPDEELPRGLSRYLATTGSLDSREPLLACVRFQGKMIGMLVLGERGDRQAYAGPDFEALHLLFTRYASVLQTARLYAQVNQHVTILDKLYSTNAVPIHDFETIDQAAMAYARIAADAVSSGAAIWLYEEKEKHLRRIIFIGTGPRLVQQDILTPSQEEDWLPWFFEGDSSQIGQGTSEGKSMPSCLSQAPCFPFVWLPLNRGDQHLGLLVLTYSQPHHFSHEERRVLEMFATQCVAALENVRITLALRAAYERQKELDRLKDEFITTTSHELRTPLTAVEGYLELLATYHSTMEASMLDNFLAKASRGCEELALMVGNITDASRVQVDVKAMSLNVISLNESVQHVLEIIEAGARREQRTIQAAIPADLFVIADKMRLRQILLNLLSNALKYSPAGSDIEIVVDMDEEQVTVCVHDHGSGVPLAEQERLFERFVRLERDMNSPTRGAGLGLYISKQLVEAMGGRIWIESTGIPDEGSTFIFTLQRSIAQKPALVPQVN